MGMRFMSFIEAPESIPIRVMSRLAATTTMFGSRA
jgi:hypothetical protein